MVMAKLHMICGNCGSNEFFSYEVHEELDSEGEPYCGVHLTCNNCGTLHNLEDNADRQDFHSRLAPDWVEVESYEDIPAGVWLVEIPGDQPKYHVLDNEHKNIPVLGGHFIWDMLDKTKAIKYKRIV